MQKVSLMKPKPPKHILRIQLRKQAIYHVMSIGICCIVCVKYTSISGCLGFIYLYSDASSLLFLSTGKYMMYLAESS